MNIIKRTKREIENVIYTNTLYVNNEIIDGELVTDFYVILDTSLYDELFLLEPTTLEEALESFNDIEEYLIVKANAYDDLLLKLKSKK